MPYQRFQARVSISHRATAVLVLLYPCDQVVIIYQKQFVSLVLSTDRPLAVSHTTYPHILYYTLFQISLYTLDITTLQISTQYTLHSRYLEDRRYTEDIYTVDIYTEDIYSPLSAYLQSATHGQAPILGCAAPVRALLTPTPNFKLGKNLSRAPHSPAQPSPAQHGGR